jgi:hypothetical protein
LQQRAVFRLNEDLFRIAATIAIARGAAPPPDYSAKF